MSPSFTTLRNSVQRLQQMWRGIVVGYAPKPPKRGTAAWVDRLEDDVVQAQRNAKDLEYVLVRQQGRIRHAGEEDARWSEEFAMAYIEAQVGLQPEARLRLQRALDQGVLPSSCGSIIAPTIGRAAAVGWDGAPGMIRVALQRIEALPLPPSHPSRHEAVIALKQLGR